MKNIFDIEYFSFEISTDIFKLSVPKEERSSVRLIVTNSVVTLKVIDFSKVK